MIKNWSYRTAIALVLIVQLGCAAIESGPDKQGKGVVSGAALGATSGAVTGFQLSAATGPGAFVGAGIGAVAGSIQGLAQDQEEAEILALSKETNYQRQVAIAHEILGHQTQRRLELHPTRELYPADLFFEGDEVKLRAERKILVEELAKLNKSRLPYSRLVIAAYVKAKDDNSEYAKYLAAARSTELSNYFIQAGVEPRRIESRAVLITEPVLIDPYDDANRYNQAVEIIPLDR